MPLGNYVILETDVPERMHFTDHVVLPREITDPATLRPKTVNAIEFTVDRLNGQPVNAKFSTLSEKLYGMLEAYLPGQAYRGYDFIITKTGTGFRTQFKVDRIPLS